MFFDGAVRAVGLGESDSGEHFDDGDTFARQTGFRMGDYGKPHRRRGKNSGGRCGDVSEVCGGGGERVSGVEGVECEDYDECEAGVGVFL